MKSKAMAWGLALAVLACTATVAGEKGELIAEHTFAAGAVLAFDSDRGKVTIRGENRADILIRVEAIDIDVDDAREALQLEFDERADGLYVRARFKNSGWLSSLFGNSGNVYYDVRVPRRIKLNIDNGSGGFVAEEIDGRVSVDNGSGGIRLRNIAGDVTVDNGSGGIRIEGVEGALSIDNGSGGVRVLDVRGDVQIDNGSGGVHLEGIDGALRVETSSGGVSARMSGANAGIDAETGSGGVRITVPARWGAVLDMRAGSGSVVLKGWPDLDVDDARRFRGEVGGGGPLIRMVSSSGDVALIAD